VNNCAIHINPTFIAGKPTPAVIHSVLIHEMTHCFYFQLLGAAAYELPQWFNDGSATWAQYTLEPGGSDDYTLQPWEDYLGSPGTSLYARTYDAVGFFAHLAETSSASKVWEALVPMANAMKRSSSRTGCPSIAVCNAGWTAADVSTAFLDSWGSSFTEGTYPGTAWSSSGPGLPVEDPAPALGHSAALADGQTVTVSTAATSASIKGLDVTAEVVQISGNAYGHISLGHGATATLAAAASATYCTAGEACTCPANTPKYGTVFTPMSAGTEYIGATGGLSAAHVSVKGMSLASFCKPPDAPCLMGAWSARGWSRFPSRPTSRGTR
jgi:hypothetical protein